MSQAKHKVTLWFHSAVIADVVRQIAERGISEGNLPIADKMYLANQVCRAVAVRYKPVVKKGGQK